MRRVIFRSDGNVTKAAKILKVSSSDLRRLTWRHPTLIMDALERVHCMIDKAESKLREALDGDHAERSLRAALFILSHNDVARERGWGRHGGGDRYDAPPPAAAPTAVIWGDGSRIYRPPLPSAPEARRAALAEPGSASEADRIH